MGIWYILVFVFFWTGMIVSMKILITNDDGIHAPGLWALNEVFSRDHNVSVVAPDREISGVGHGITLNAPIRAEKITVNGCGEGYAVSGTPADCIKFAMTKIYRKKPDMVVSGINPGANVGLNINYSGTVAAAKEAALFGVFSMAVSIHGHKTNYYGEAAAFVADFSQNIREKNFPSGVFLNINIPNIPLSKTKGVKWCRLGNGLPPRNLEKRMDPRGKSYYWHGSDSQTRYKDTDIDGFALAGNFIAVTPVKCDVTDHEILGQLDKWQVPVSSTRE